MGQNGEGWEMLFDDNLAGGEEAHRTHVRERNHLQLAYLLKQELRGKKVSVKVDVTDGSFRCLFAEMLNERLRLVSAPAHGRHFCCKPLQSLVQSPENYAMCMPACPSISLVQRHNGSCLFNRARIRQCWFSILNYKQHQQQHMILINPLEESSELNV